MSQQAQLTPIQRLASLKEREVAVRREEDRLRLNFENVQTELKKASEKIIAQHGTDDVGQLRSKFKQDKDLDIAALNTFEESIDTVEKIVTTVNTAVNALRVS
ncbi:hypothetical protein V0M98_32015 (plasmid) [Pseudomonas silesiensis]|uniref:hypothetical protein n=1 Tax=Pseudomonas silesiensis TaxID=1853130 RepID=UPI0030CE1255